MSLLKKSRPNRDAIAMSGLWTNHFYDETAESVHTINLRNGLKAVLESKPHWINDPVRASS